MHPLEGHHLRSPDGMMFVVIEGRAREIPSMDCYRAFSGGMVFDAVPFLPVPTIPGAEIQCIPPVTIGTELGLNSCLLRQNDDGAEDFGFVYFFDGTRAWHILNMATMRFYGFREDAFVAIGGGGIDWGAVARLGIGVLGSVFGGADNGNGDNNN